MLEQETTNPDWNVIEQDAQWVALCIRQDRLDGLQWDLELFCDFGRAHAIVEVVDDGVDQHTRSTQDRRAALHLRFGFHERAFRPIDLFQARHNDVPLTHDSTVSAKLLRAVIVTETCLTGADYFAP